MLADAALKRERAIKSVFVQIVKEQSADAAGFVSMRQKKVAIAPAFVFLVEIGSECLARIPRGSMPVQHILIEWVVRREVEAAAEPPDFRAGGRTRNQESDIAMGGRRIRISRMKHQ